MNTTLANLNTTQACHSKRGFLPAELAEASPLPAALPRAGPVDDEIEEPPPPEPPTTPAAGPAEELAEPATAPPAEATPPSRNTSGMRTSSSSASAGTSPRSNAATTLGQRSLCCCLVVHSKPCQAQNLSLLKVPSDPPTASFVCDLVHRSRPTCCG